MNYNKNKFNSDVRYYQRKLEKVRKKNIFLIFHIDNKNAYYSLAPLSKAAHTLGKDIHVYGYNKSRVGYDILQDIWEVYSNRNKRMDHKTAALMKFINHVDKKTKKQFSKLFDKPAIMEAGELGFVEKGGKNSFDFRTSWLVKKDKWKLLLKTSSVIWKQVYNLKKDERVGCSIDLVPDNKNLERPLNDILGSFVIMDAMMESIKKRCKDISLGAASPRYSMHAFPEKTSDLMATLSGCEYEKNIKEMPFKLFKEVSKLFGTSKLKPKDAAFGIYGKGKHGKHIFGESIGYPTPNGKSRWNSPGAMFYKFSWLPQAKYDKREPQARVGFTDTVPIADFIATSNIDWFKMHKKNQKITDILNKAEKIVAEGKKSNFTVHLVGKKSRRYAMNSDIDIRTKIDEDYYKKTGIKTGTMANIPGGESFITPEYIEGTISGDVVINIDQSYRLYEKEPLVIECSKEGYKVVSGPKKILKKLNEKKKEAWKKILDYEKMGAMPKEIVKMKKDNFEKIGEFAINTNPKAKLTDYLIINEKIANMMHVALGSGFEPDRSTEYHYDIVFNSKKQKLDVYAVSGKKKTYILKKGRFVI